MSDDATRLELQALMTRAATAEAARQAACAAGDLPAVLAAEQELRALQARHSELEAQSAA